MIFGFLVLSFGFKVYLGHFGFIEANALLQMCDILSHLQGPEHLSHKIRFLITSFQTKNHQLNFAQQEFDFESTSALLIQHLSRGGRRGLASRKSRVVFQQKDFRLIIFSFFFQSVHLHYRQSTYLKEGVEKKQSSVCRRALSVDLVDLWILQSPFPVRMWIINIIIIATTILIIIISLVDL